MDVVTPEKRSSMMREIKSRDTKCELAVRRQLHRWGYRFKTCVRDMPGKPDLVFASRKAVVFVDGCFFHRCPHHVHKKGVQSNVEFWEKKFAANIARDLKNTALLEGLGWRVIRVWECEVTGPKKRDVGGKMLQIASLLGPPKWVR